MQTNPRIHDIYAPDPYTWTGTCDINLLDPQPEQLHMVDINRSLSREGRYSNMSELPWTVGQHILLCTRLAVVDGVTDLDTLRAIAMHDASEAFLKDINRPLKKTPQMSGYCELEEMFEVRIRERFGIAHSSALHDVIKKYDNLALTNEVHMVMPAVVSRWGQLPEPSGMGMRVVEMLLKVRQRGVEDMLNRLAWSLEIKPVIGDDVTTGE